MHHKLRHVPFGPPWAEADQNNALPCRPGLPPSLRSDPQDLPSNKDWGEVWTPVEYPLVSSDGQCATGLDGELPHVLPFILEVGLCGTRLRRYGVAPCARPCPYQIPGSSDVTCRLHVCLKFMLTLPQPMAQPSRWVPWPQVVYKVRRHDLCLDLAAQQAANAKQGRAEMGTDRLGSIPQFPLLLSMKQFQGGYRYMTLRYALYNISLVARLLCPASPSLDHCTHVSLHAIHTKTHASWGWVAWKRPTPCGPVTFLNC